MIEKQNEPIFVDPDTVAKVLGLSVELLFASTFVKDPDDDVVAGLKKVIARELSYQMETTWRVREVVRRTFVTTEVAPQWCSRWFTPEKLHDVFDLSAYPSSIFEYTDVATAVMAECEDFIETVCKTTWGEDEYRWIQFATPSSVPNTTEANQLRASGKLWEMMEAAFNDNLVVAANKQSGVFLNLLLDVFEETPCYDNTSIEWFVDKVLATGQSTIKDRVMENLSFDDIMRVMNHSETNVTRWRKYYIRYIADKVPST